VVRLPPEDRVISIFTGCLANHDRSHSLTHVSEEDLETTESEGVDLLGELLDLG
jgi:hypothetical protein